MTKIDLALSLIRAPWFTRMTDRTFLLALAGGGIALWLFTQKAIDGNALMEALGAFWAPWILAHQAKDAYIGGQAVASAPADSAAQPLAGSVSALGVTPAADEEEGTPSE